MKWMEEVGHVDYDTEKSKIQETVKSIRAKGLIHFLLTKGLRPFEDKKVNKRCIRYLKDDGYTVHWERDAWGIDISVWGCGLDYQDRLHFHLPMALCDSFSVSEWEKKHTYWEASNVDKMVSGYAEMLDSLVDFVVEFNVKADTFNEALRELKEAEKNFSIPY